VILFINIVRLIAEFSVSYDAAWTGMCVDLLRRLEEGLNFTSTFGKFHDQAGNARK
jgi:hypothetical protein